MENETASMDCEVKREAYQLGHTPSKRAKLDKLHPSFSVVGSGTARYRVIWDGQTKRRCADITWTYPFQSNLISGVGHETLLNDLSLVQNA